MSTPLHHYFAGLARYDAWVNERLYDDLDSVRDAQLADDVELYDYVRTLTEDDMLQPIPYQGCDGTAHANSLQEILAQLFTDKARLQGRICEQLSQLDVAEPDLDYVAFLRQTG